MAHPGLLGAGGFAVALIVAGVWLNQRAETDRAGVAAAPAEETPAPPAAPAEPPPTQPPPPADAPGVADTPEAADIADVGEAGEIAAAPESEGIDDAVEAEEGAEAPEAGKVVDAAEADVVTEAPEAGGIDDADEADKIAAAPEAGEVADAAEANEIAAAPEGEEIAAAPETAELPDAPAPAEIADDATGPDPADGVDTLLPSADHLVGYGGAPVWRLDLPEGLAERQRRSIAEALSESYGDAPYFGVAALSPDGDRLGVVTGFAALAPAEAAVLGSCGAKCRIVARLVPEDFDGRRTDTLNAAQAAARARLLQEAQEPGVRVGFSYVLAWSDEGAVGTGSLGVANAARIIANLECNLAQRRITGLHDRAPPCRAALVAGRP